MNKTAFLLPIVLACTVTLQAQSLADFARQERERKKNIETRIIITNETLNAGKTPASTGASLAVAPEAEAKPAPEAKPADSAAAVPAPSLPANTPTDNQGRDEKSWRAAFAQARESLKRAEDQEKASELKLNQLKRDYLLRGDVYNKEQLAAAEINTTTARLDLAHKDLAAARQAISELEEGLRRAGGPAGWGR